MFRSYRDFRLRFHIGENKNHFGRSKLKEPSSLFPRTETRIEEVVSHRVAFAVTVSCARLSEAVVDLAAQEHCTSWTRNGMRRRRCKAVRMTSASLSKR